MKKFFALLTILFLLTVPAQAQTVTIDNADDTNEAEGIAVEKFYASLPQATGDYNSKRRPILLEGAMNIETEIFVRALKNPTAYRELNYLFVAGTYKNYPVVVVRTEQGLANAAAATALAIKKFNPIAVINQGTAGGHDPALKIGDIVIGAKTLTMFAIKSASSAAGSGVDITRQEMRGTYAYDEASGTFQPHKEFSTDPTLFNIAFAVADAHENFNAVSGTIGTADAWLQGFDHIAFLHKKYGTTCEDMETAAVAQICKNAGVPFIGIRILSDNVTSTEAYDPSTATTAQNFVLRVVEKYISTILNR